MVEHPADPVAADDERKELEMLDPLVAAKLKDCRGNVDAPPKAKELFDQSYGLAEAAFKNDRQVSTLHSFQFAAMNKANFLTVLALKGERSDKERREKLDEALNMYYMVLTVSNKMRKDMLSRCIPAIQSIYKYYEGGEVAAAALSRIFGGSYGTTAWHFFGQEGS